MDEHSKLIDMITVTSTLPSNPPTTDDPKSTPSVVPEHQHLLGMLHTCIDAHDCVMCVAHT
jgi:hypothetical protein